MKLTATNATSGCPVSVDSTLVYIRKIQANIDVPNIICGGEDAAFSANGSVDVEVQCNRGYKWIFSDPGVRPVATPNPDETFDFDINGPQSVMLVVTDINGCTDTADLNFEVFNVDAILDVNDTVVCSPANLVFTDMSTSDAAIDTWQWITPDSIILNGQNQTYILDTTFIDTSYVTLIVTDIHGCTDTAVQNMFSYFLNSNVSINPFNGHLCAGESAQFSHRISHLKGLISTFHGILGMVRLQHCRTQRMFILLTQPSL